MCDLVLVAELEAWPEPKALAPSALRALMGRFGGSHGAARIIGASEAFVRQNGRETRVRGKTQKCKTGRPRGAMSSKNRPV